MIELSLLFYAVFAAADPSTDIVSLISKAGAPTLLAIIVVGAMKEWWVPGPTHRRMVKERDELLRLALSGQEVGSRALDTASIIASAARLRKEGLDVPET